MSTEALGALQLKFAEPGTCSPKDLRRSSNSLTGKASEDFKTSAALGIEFPSVVFSPKQSRKTCLTSCIALEGI